MRWRVCAASEGHTEAKKTKRPAFVLSRRNTNRFFRAFSPLLSKDEGEPRTREFFSPFSHFSSALSRVTLPAQTAPTYTHTHLHVKQCFLYKPSTPAKEWPRSSSPPRRSDPRFFCVESSRRAERKRLHGRNRRRRRPIRGEGVRNGGRDTGG